MFAVTLVGLLSLNNLGLSMVSVLCIGEDGHVDLEVLVHGRCGDFGHKAQHISGKSSTLLNECLDDHCGLCVDLPAPEASRGKYIPRSNDLNGSLSFEITHSTVMVDVTPVVRGIAHHELQLEPNNYLYSPLLRKTTLLI